MTSLVIAHIGKVIEMLICFAGDRFGSLIMNTGSFRGGETRNTAYLFINTEPTAPLNIAYAISEIVF